MADVVVVVDEQTNVEVTVETIATVVVEVPGPPGPAGPPGAGDTGGMIFRQMTQEEFDAITPPGNQVTYIVEQP